ncbi:hypothetical protein AB0K92_16095 [Streptomyces sp. NPDC052687]|uniref:hypothetical protein n=1 Tax=Streptomyces sp. NPDC052687 TaxID=3154759 RepID=UPI00342B4D55
MSRSEIHRAFLRGLDEVDKYRDLMDTIYVTRLIDSLKDEVMGLLGPESAVLADSGGMSRADALKLAREHVEAMATNGRGYQDGVKLADKVQAAERFARFLMGEES